MTGGYPCMTATAQSGVARSGLRGGSAIARLARPRRVKQKDLLMSYRHHVMDSIAPRMSTAEGYEIDNAIDVLMAEHGLGTPSIEERCARAEALAILVLEKLRRIEQEQG